MAAPVGDWDGDPATARYGCFLPDLTGLASALSTASLPGPLYQDSCEDTQAGAHLRGCARACEGAAAMKDSPTFEGNVFAGGGLDRAGHQRRDEAWVDGLRADPAARFLPLWRLEALIDGAAPAIAWLDGAAVAEDMAAGAQSVLLGLDGAVAHFAVDLSARSEDARGKPPFADKGAFHDVRRIAGQVPRGDAAILAQARSMIDWHARHGFCAQCGGPTRSSADGYVRRCTDQACDAQHFPRTDPVVIMLVTDGERCLVGRSGRFAIKLYSALAGFLEPGETIEEGVRREVMEEAGIKVGAVRYHSSQPWPYPSSLMIGCIADALTTDIHVDGEELEDAHWFGRDVMREAVARAATITDPLTRAPQDDDSTIPILPAPTN